MSAEKLEEWVLGMPSDASIRTWLGEATGVPLPPPPEHAAHVKCHACGMDTLMGPLCVQAIEQGGKPACVLCVLKKRVSTACVMVPIDAELEKGGKSNAN